MSRRKTARQGRPAALSNQRFKIAATAYGQEPGAGPALDAESMRDTLRCDADLAGVQDAVHTVDLDADRSIQDMDDLVLIMMNMERRTIAIRHAMFDNADPVRTVGRREADGDAAIEKLREVIGGKRHIVHFGCPNGPASTAATSYR